jgi:hypothetical protein
MRCQAKHCDGEAKFWLIKGGQTVKVWSSCTYWLLSQGWVLKNESDRQFL